MCSTSHFGTWVCLMLPTFASFLSVYYPDKSQSRFCIDFVVAIYLAHIRWVFLIILFYFFQIRVMYMFFLLWILHTNNKLWDTFPVLLTFLLVHPYLSLLHVNVHFIYTVLLLVFDFYIAVVSSQLGYILFKNKQWVSEYANFKKKIIG